MCPRRSRTLCRPTRTVLPPHLAQHDAVMRARIPSFIDEHGCVLPESDVLIGCLHQLSTSAGERAGNMSCRVSVGSRTSKT